MNIISILILMSKFDRYFTNNVVQLGVRKNIDISAKFGNHGGPLSVEASRGLISAGN